MTLHTLLEENMSAFNSEAGGTEPVGRSSANMHKLAPSNDHMHW